MKHAKNVYAFLNLRSQIVTSRSPERGGARYAPMAFTEKGVAMLSSVLRSKQAAKERRAPYGRRSA